MSQSLLWLFSYLIIYHIFPFFASALFLKWVRDYLVLKNLGSSVLSESTTTDSLHGNSFTIAVISLIIFSLLVILTLEVMNMNINFKMRPPIDGDIDRPIPSDVYPVIDTDLARDNVEQDLSAADLQDLH